MAVKIGSARSSYGDTSPGDQNNGKEVSTQDYYVSDKGWVLLRCKDRAKRALIAEAMQKACDNNNIGYSQGTRNTLWDNVKGSGYDPSKTTKAVNTDCSALVRVCCAYAGIVVSDFITSTLSTRLMATGKFEKLTSDKYCKSSDYLMVGDILCTRTKGHVVVVLTDGRKAEYEPIDANALTVTGDSVNVRKGPGTSYDVVCVVNKGDTLTKIDTSGWTPVVKDGQVLWISSKYVK